MARIGFGNHKLRLGQTIVLALVQYIHSMYILPGEDSSKEVFITLHENVQRIIFTTRLTALCWLPSSTDITQIDVDVELGWHLEGS